MKDKEKTEIIYGTLVKYLTSWGRDRENVVLPELRCGSGFSGSSERYIDVFCISSSKGNVTTAYEIKASRADFLKDIKNPLKQRGARLYSTFFYYVAPKGMIKLDEVPLWAGLIEVDVSSDEPYLSCQVDAPNYSRQQPSWSLICSIVRKLRKEYGYEEIKKLQNELKKLKKLKDGE